LSGKVYKATYCLSIRNSCVHVLSRVGVVCLVLVGGLVSAAHAQSGGAHYGVRMGTAPIGSRVVLSYDLTPAEWGSGSVTMRFLVENYPKKVIPTFFEGSTMFDRYVSYKSYGRYKMRISKQGDTSGKVGSITS
jgi:hypothetical protein